MPVYADGSVCPAQAAKLFSGEDTHPQIHWDQRNLVHGQLLVPRSRNIGNRVSSVSTSWWMWNVLQSIEMIGASA